MCIQNVEHSGIYKKKQTERYSKVHMKKKL